MGESTELELELWKGMWNFGGKLEQQDMFVRVLWGDNSWWKVRVIDRVRECLTLQTQCRTWLINKPPFSLLILHKISSVELQTRSICEHFHHSPWLLIHHYGTKLDLFPFCTIKNIVDVIAIGLRQLVDPFPNNVWFKEVIWGSLHRSKFPSGNEMIIQKGHLGSKDLNHFI